MACVRVSAPGKVILHGEHAVMFGKLAIAGSLGLRSSVKIKELQAPTLQITFTSVDLSSTVQLQAVNQLLKSSSSTWQTPHTYQHSIQIEITDKFLSENVFEFHTLNNYQKNALRSFFYLIPGVLGGITLDRGLEVEVSSELTIGAGTGSSASFAVCLAGGLLQLAKMKNGNASNDFSAEDKELISAWAYNSEKIMHGAPSGIDNATATFGSLVSLIKGQPPVHLSLGLDLRVLLVNTGVSRETRAVAARVAERRGWTGGAIEKTVDAIGCVTEDAVAILKKLSVATSEAELDEGYQHLSTLWDMNHCLLSALGVSHAALEAVRAAAARHALVAKLTGAGGGGYAIVLVPPKTAESSLDALKTDLKVQGFEVTDTTLGGRGVTIDECS
ncbi:mevalonate kinase [Aricia agestis]|uniref:mevalonate kinase n=1 Tax=Aricia agestis TaxID=91739 RepID=UPI001C20C2EA|nr:mevalonate kinase [Aricia agestis]